VAAGGGGDRQWEVALGRRSVAVPNLGPDLDNCHRNFSGSVAAFSVARERRITDAYSNMIWLCPVELVILGVAHRFFESASRHPSSEE
ncbi:hypothetical protein Dimus_005352, partial [Dionaea muscipula]